MKVTSSAVSQGRTISVELEEQDVVPALYSQEVWQTQSPQAKHRLMMQEADLMVVRYLWEAELITSEYAVQRINEIRSRTNKPGV